MIMDLVKTSRSCRAFDSSYTVSKQDAAELIDVARFCPSAVNRQPIKYYIVTGKEECGKMLPLVRMGGLLKELKLPPSGREPSAYIIMCLDSDVKSIPAFSGMDIGIAAQTIMLAASEKGLGGCMIAAFDKDKVRDAFDLSENLDPALVLSLGKPDEEFRLCEVEDGHTEYFRDENGVHNVPKRKLDEIIVNL